MSNKTAQDMQSTTALQSVNSLSTRVKQLLDTLTPMMQGLQQSVPQISSALQEIEQLKKQVAQLETIKGKLQEVTQTQTADDNAYDEMLSEAHEECCKDVIPLFWRKNLDYGER